MDGAPAPPPRSTPARSMLSLLRRKMSPAAPPPPATASAPEGVRLYAIGDVHGRDDLLVALLAAIRADASAHPDRKPTIVFLGDYVDRGAASRQVIDRLIAWPEQSGFESRFVMGNHDDTFRQFLEDASVGPTWCDFGGGTTLDSYGVVAPAGRGDAESWEAARQALLARIPSSHGRFLRELEYSVIYGDYFFAHAGARPGVALEAQSPEDLMWIRDEFLTSRHTWSRTVVHGHTPDEQPFVSGRRIGLDTGAYATGRLTAVVLDGASRGLIQARAAGAAGVQVQTIGVPA